MHRLKGWLTRMRALLHAERANRELDEEILFHLEQETAKLERSGLSPEEARRRAMLAFGGVARTREAHRDVRVVRWLADLIADARFALRSIRRAPVIAGAAVITLALGIGAATAIYTVVDAVIVRPLPFPHSERLFVIGEDNAERDWHLQDASPANYLDWKEQVPAFESIGGFSDGHSTATLTGEGEPRVVSYAQVTGSFFDMLGVRPQLGRVFRDEESWHQPAPIIVISDRFWREVLGGSAGRDRQDDSSERQAAADHWRDAGGLRVSVRGCRHLAHDGLGSIRPGGCRIPARALPPHDRAREAGVTAATANAQLQAVVRRLQQQYPVTNTGMGASMQPLHEFITGDARRPLILLFGAVGLLLLIACANVGNLLLVQAIGRQRELSLRLALGAGRTRLVRQALTESLVLSVLGGLAGLAVGWAGVRVLATIQPQGMLPVGDIGIDWRVLVFLAAVTTVCGLLFGIAPSLWGQRQLPANALREGGRSAGDGMRLRRWGDVLVVGEVALALLLTVGAGLLVRSYSALRRVNPGFESAGVLTVSIELVGGRYDSCCGAHGIRRAAARSHSRDAGRAERGDQLVAAAHGPRMDERLLGGGTRAR